MQDLVCSYCMRTIQPTSYCPFCKAPVPFEQPFPDLLPPGALLHSRYQIGRCMGRGGFGITYIALDIQNGSRCAVKEYFPHGQVERVFSTQVRPHQPISFKKGVDRFSKEANILRSLRDIDGVVRCDACFEENGTAYFAMEYLEGSTLYEYQQVKGGVLPLREVMDIALCVLNTLESVHARGLLHRDISTSNLFRTEKGLIKLIDFGSARMESQQEMNALTRFMTPGYSPPEQTSSDTWQGCYTDIYALGACMYKLLTGALPVQTESASLSVRALDPSLPAWVDTVLSRACDIGIDKRYQSASEMRADILRQDKPRASPHAPFHVPFSRAHASKRAVGEGKRFFLFISLLFLLPLWCVLLWVIISHIL